MSAASELHERIGRFDLDRLDSLLRICSMRFTVLDAKRPRAVYGSQVQADAVACSAAYAFALRAHFRLPSGWCLIGYAHQAPAGSWVGGELLESGAMMLVQPDRDCEIMLRAQSCWSALLLPVRNLQRDFLAAMQQTSRASVVLCPRNHSGLGARARTSFESLRQRFVEHDMNADVRAVDDQVLAFLDADVAATAAASGIARTRRAHYRSLRRVEQFMHENLRRDIHLADFCAAGNTSERNLRYIFDEFLGISPLRYLSMQRLCLARRKLIAAQSKASSVRAIALDCGMWNLSRFAQHYRQLFGELPSRTLRRPSRHLPKSGMRNRHSGVQYG